MKLNWIIFRITFWVFKIFDWYTFRISLTIKLCKKVFFYIVWECAVKCFFMQMLLKILNIVLQILIAVWCFYIPLSNFLKVGINGIENSVRNKYFNIFRNFLIKKRNLHLPWIYVLSLHTIVEQLTSLSNATTAVHFEQFI